MFLRSLQRVSLAAGGAALGMVTLSSPAASAESSESASAASDAAAEATAPPPSTEGAAVIFLDGDSKAQLATLFESQFDGAAVRGGDAPRGYTLGDEVELEVRSVAQTLVEGDEAEVSTSVSVLCAVAEAPGAEGAPSTFYAIAQATGSAAGSDNIFDRLARAKVLEVSELPVTSSFAWRGRLPRVASDASSDDELVSLERLAASAEAPRVIRGTLCTAERWDAATATCASGSGSGGEEEEEEVHECGFCKFMKAGPCGDAFVAWEKCIETCKDNDTDFIEKCGPQTLALKDCVDANPDYYSVLEQLDDAVEEESEE